jgi:hypothetical protein
MDLVRRMRDHTPSKRPDAATARLELRQARNAQIGNRRLDAQAGRRRTVVMERLRGAVRRVFRR